jgi:predicted nucleotidyltransferase
MGTIIPNMGITSTNLGNALFSKGQQCLLALLFGHPDRSFYANELIHLADTGTGAIQRELAKLTAAGLITVQRLGNQKHYQANPATPIFAELRAIVLKTFGLTDVLQQALLPIADKIRLAFIYGSIAKQQDTSKSDIDLMIISDTLTYADIFPLLEKAEAQLARPINPSIYSTSEWKQKRDKGSAFVTRVLAQPKIYLIGKENDGNQSG